MPVGCCPRVSGNGKLRYCQWYASWSQHCHLIIVALLEGRCSLISSRSVLSRSTFPALNSSLLALPVVIVVVVLPLYAAVSRRASPPQCDFCKAMSSLTWAACSTHNRAYAYVARRRRPRSFSQASKELRTLFVALFQFSKVTAATTSRENSLLLIAVAPSAAARESSGCTGRGRNGLLTTAGSTEE